MDNKLGAVNQTVKSLVKAQCFLAQNGIDIVFKPGFEDVQGDNKVISAIVIKVIVIR